MLAEPLWSEAASLLPDEAIRLADRHTRIRQLIDRASQELDRGPAGDAVFELATSGRGVRLLGALLQLSPSRRTEWLAIDGGLDPERIGILLQLTEVLEEEPPLVEALARTLPSWFRVTASRLPALPTSSTRPLVLIGHAPDGEPLLRRVERRLRHEPLTLLSHASPLPQVWDSACGLLLCSPQVREDTALLAWADALRSRGFPVVPVVRTPADWPRSAWPTVLGREEEVVSLEPGAAPELRELIRTLLGYGSRPDNCHVFIAYRRADGEAIASELYDQLWSRRFPALPDPFSLEEGPPDPERIREALADRELVLLVATPAASSSSWITEELTEALSSRIPVRVISTGSQPPLPLIADLEQLVWDPTRPDRHERVEQLVVAGL